MPRMNFCLYVSSALASTISGGCKMMSSIDRVKISVAGLLFTVNKFDLAAIATMYVVPQEYAKDGSSASTASPFPQVPCNL